MDFHVVVSPNQASFIFFSSREHSFILCILSCLVLIYLLSLSCPSAFSSLSLMATEISPPSLWTEVQVAIQRLWGTTWELGEVSWSMCLVEITNQTLKGKGRLQRTVSVGVERSGKYGGFKGDGWIWSLWCPMDCSPTRLLCPWNSPGKNTGAGSHSLPEGIFPTQGSNPGLHQCKQIFYHLSHQRSPVTQVAKKKKEQCINASCFYAHASLQYHFAVPSSKR